MGLRSRMVAMYWRVRRPGRITGDEFVIRNPQLLRITSEGRLAFGARAFIESGARIDVQANMSLHDDVYIGKNSTLVAFSSIEIGARTLLGENVSLHTEDHGPPGRRFEYISAPIKVGEDSWIGAGTVVLKGVTIGSRVTVGANSLVNRDLPDDCLAAGVPAVVKRRL